MKIAVVTPVYRTDRTWLDRCVASVALQTAACTHFLVSDGDNELQESDFNGVEFLRLPKPHADFGNTARAIGSVAAFAEGFDAVAYLDADNWFARDHVECIVGLHRRTKAAVCSCARTLVDLDGELLGQCREVDGKNFVDTSCLFLTQSASAIIPAWYGMPRPLVSIGDRVIWKAIKQANLPRAHSPKPTVFYRTNYAVHYEYFGRSPPDQSKRVHVKVTPTGDYLSANTTIVAGVPPPANARAFRPRVSLCMIVKNEEKHLAGCLAPLAYLFYEIIVIDTGSTDRTREIAARYGARIYDFGWVDSFAAARNESLRHATGDWVLWLDADDRLDDANLEKLRNLLRDLPDDNNAYMMCQWSAPDPMTGSPLTVDQVRLFRNLPLARWSYRVHEQIYLALRAQGAKEVGTDIVIHHLGYQEGQTRRRKQDRNLRLLLLEAAENPNDGFVQFNLANAYLDLGETEKALVHLQRSKETALAQVSFLPRAYFLSAVCCHQLGRDEEALAHCRDGKKFFPEAADLWFEEGIVLLARGAWAEAKDSFERILGMKPHKNYMGVDADMTGYRTHFNLALAYRKLGLPQNAEAHWLIIIEQWPHFAPAWMALVELYLEQNKGASIHSLLLRLESNPHEAAIRPALHARLSLGREEFAVTRQTLEKGIAHAPKALWLRFILVDMLLRVANDEKGAEEQLRAILSLAPNEGQARLKLAQITAARQAQLNSLGTTSAPKES